MINFTEFFIWNLHHWNWENQFDGLQKNPANIY